MSAVRIERNGNDFYPLPPDYLELTPEGQRMARVNACRQWLPTTSLLRKFAL